VNIPLLHRLRRAQGAFIPLAELGDDLPRLMADLEEWEALGYALERHPYRGVAYRGPAQRLCPDLVEWELHPGRIGRRIAFWDRVGSTNDLAAKAAGSRANDGLVVLAEWQSAGRGRRGRPWSAPASSSILMSVLLFPPEPLADPAWLTALGAVAAAEVVEELSGRPARIKWPNDVRVDGRKVAGILVERGRCSILGIGLNVNIRPEEFPDDLRETATSLQALRDEPLDRSEVARSLILRLDDHYGRGLAEGAAALNERWSLLLEAIGTLVRLETVGGPVVGRLIGADLTRGVRVRLAGAGVRTLPTAEVTAIGAMEPDDQAARSRTAAPPGGS
jgi:BirA family biotin operon repressor/biotin-[acetyl-CoA-carboxylase] ligase